MIENRNTFPEWFRNEVKATASTSRWLVREREPSMYGDEELGLPPRRIYTYAEKAFKEAAKIVELTSKLIEEGSRLT